MWDSLMCKFINIYIYIYVWLTNDNLIDRLYCVFSQMTLISLSIWEIELNIYIYIYNVDSGIGKLSGYIFT